MRHISGPLPRTSHVASRKNDRIFNRDGLRHYRRTYSLTEVRIGAVIVAILIGIAGWISWKGKHPDPELFSVAPNLLANGTQSVPEKGRADAIETGQSAVKGDKPAGSGASDKRGPVPTGLAAAGWREQSLSRFDPDNLYVKIDGREGYYKSFGFKMLYVIALARDDDETATVDIEMYDLSTVANALGAYAGERQPDAKSRMGAAGIGHIARNALYLVRGRFYIRAVGSDENDVIMAQLTHLEKVLDAGLPSEELPWGHAVFAAQMGIDPGKIGFVPENAYSFGFARSVFSAQLDDDGAELFATATASDDDARKLAQQFADGFKSYGEIEARADGVDWVKDRYLGNVSGAKAVRSLVIGVYSGADIDSAKTALARLAEVANALPTSVLERAAEAASRPTGGGGEYGDAKSDEGTAEPSDDAEKGDAQMPEERPEEMYNEEPGRDEPVEEM